LLPVILQDMKLAAGDLVTLDRIRFGIERAHVFNEAARGCGRYAYIRAFSPAVRDIA
jgi:hypothetical protein